jgi:hypothetical protein
MRLAQSFVVGNGLEDRELPRCQITENFALEDVACALTSAVQQVDG